MAAISYTITRTGDLTKDGSVDYTIEYDLAASDFAPGQSKTGTVSWVANETAAKTVTYNTVGNTADNPNRFLRLRLSNPVNGVLGAVTAETTIVDDDATPASSFDQSLPMGGLGVGAACQVGQPGNYKVQASSIVSVRCEHTGKIDRIQWNNRFDLPGGNTGYHDGDGGNIHWTLRRITSGIPGSSTLVLGPVLGQTANVNNPIANASWNTHFQAAGGSGNAPLSFARYPTMEFPTPIDVTAGEYLAFTQVQTESGAVSINNAYSSKRVQTDFSPYLYGENTRFYRNGSLSSRYEEHYPNFLYGFTDGTVCGNPYQGYASGDLDPVEELILIGQGVRARQIFPMPSWAVGKVVRRVHAFMCRYDNTTTADIRCRILTAGATVGGSSDQGTLVASSTLGAADIRFETNIKGTSGSPDPIPFIVFPFTTNPAAVTIQNASYYVELVTTSGSGTRYNGHRLERVTEFATVGLRRPSCCFPNMRSQRDTGNGWTNLNTGQVHDLPLWVEFL